MMRLFELLLIVLVSFSCSFEQDCGSSKTNAFTHYIITSSSESIELGKVTIVVFNEPNGDIIFKLPPDEESGWGVTVFEENEGFFKVLNVWRQEAGVLDYWDNDWMSDFKYVWLEKGSIGIKTNNFDDGVVTIFEKPTKESDAIFSFNGVQTFGIEDVCNGWVRIIFRDENGNDQMGWLEPEYQCSNPLSNCD